MEHVSPEVYVELGAAGYTYVEIRKMMDEAMQLSSDQHEMGARGKVPVSRLKKVLIYDCGIDGMDWRVYLEEEEPKTADQLIREALDILTRHRNRPVSYGMSTGPNLSAWEQDAQRYLKAQEK